MTDEYIEVVKNDAYLRDPAKRAREMQRLFITESLPAGLPAAEWAEVQDFAPSLLEGLYKDIFMIGPHAKDYKLFHRELMLFAINRPALFPEFEDDLINTYADRLLTNSARVARHLYFDYTHAHAYGKVLSMDYRTDPLTDRGNLYQRVFAKKLFRNPKAANTALSVLTMLMLMRHIPHLTNISGSILPGRWDEMLAAHQRFCEKWGFTPLPNVPQRPVELTDVVS